MPNADNDLRESLIETLLTKHREAVSEAEEQLELIKGIEDHLESLGVPFEHYTPTIREVIPTSVIDLAVPKLEELRHAVPDNELAAMIRTPVANLKRSVQQSMNSLEKFGRIGRLVRMPDGKIGLREWLEREQPSPPL